MKKRAERRFMLGLSGYPTANVELRREAKRLLDSEPAREAIKTIKRYLARQTMSDDSMINPRPRP